MNAPLHTLQLLALPDIAEALGKHRTSILRRAEREGWSFEDVPHPGGKKRLYAAAALPKDIQSALKQRAINQALPVVAREITSTIIVHTECRELTDQQRLERDARAGIKAAITRTMSVSQCSQEAAMHTLLANARAGTLDSVTTRMLSLARDKRGRKGVGDGFPSIRSLKRWLTAADLAPKVPQRDMTVPAWAKTFLGYYQKPQKPSVNDAYAEFSADYTGSELPSIHQVRRFLDKLGTVTRERGRMGNRELKNIQPFIRRDFSLLEPNDVWSADGHAFDAEVQHPFHGRPFRPEITTFVDIATRRVVGWSVDLAESTLAVADALRNGVQINGVPALIYVDNGSGYKNAFMKDEATGLIGRIGSTMTHSLPYNSQAKGVIERLHQTLWVAGAKQLPSYIGAAMDREARLEQFKLTRKALKSGGAMPLMPWHLFVQWVEMRIGEYNAKAHRSLSGISPNLSLANFVAKGWEPHTMSSESMATLFRPRVTRTLLRAEIRLFNNIYFARELEEFHGIEAHIAYDIHDVSRVWVYLPDGRLVCEAEVNGNSKHYFPVAVVEQARQRRAQGRLDRVDAKREEILEELHGSPAMPAPAAGQVVIGGRILDTGTLSSKPEATETPAAQALPQSIGENVTKLPEVAKTRSERSAAENFAEWQDIDHRILAGETVTEQEARWHKSYQQSAQFRAEAKRKAVA